MIEYIFLVLFFIVLSFFIYIKLAYPFWNNQPVFHTYDYWRRLYSSPFIIYKYRPIKTKFCDFENIKTVRYNESTEEHQNQIVNLLQCFYLPTDRIIHTINAADMQALLTGQNEASFMSIYDKKKYGLVDVSGSLGTTVVDVVSIPNPIGCIASRSLNMTFRYSSTDTRFSKLPIYFMDYLCVHREQDNKKLSRTLLQTHEYNQRLFNPNIQVSLIKKEVDLFDGVIPLTKYFTYTFHLRNIQFNKLPKDFEVVLINNENMDMIFDFLYLQENIETRHFDILVLPEFGNIVSMIKQKLLYACCLRKGLDVFGVYFIKDSKTQFEDIEGNTLQCIGSITNCESNQLFYLGFLHSLKQILHKYPEYKMLLFENIGHNAIILENWRTRHTPIFTNKTAYYLFNFIYPGSPLAAEKCFVFY